MHFILNAQYFGQKCSWKVKKGKRKKRTDTYQNIGTCTLFTQSPDTVPLTGACGREPGVEQVDLRLHPLSPAPNQLPNW
jgi:hypothetical protein